MLQTPRARAAPWDLRCACALDAAQTAMAVLAARAGAGAKWVGDVLEAAARLTEQRKACT
jgi:hypothetical protein